MRQMRWFVILAALVVTVSPAWSQSPTLVEDAKKEGKLTWYTSMSIEDSKQMLEAFEKKYPGIKTELYRASSEKLLNKILTEARAGKHLYDVVAVNGFEANILQNKGLLAKFLPPEAATAKGFFRDPEGHWFDIYDNYFVIGYNTKMVSKADVPKDWKDLLDPKWKGKFALDEEEYEWYAGMLKYWGDAKGKEFMRALAAQQPLFRKGHTEMATLLAAGEYPIGLMYAHRMEKMKSKGAPVDWVQTTDPIMVSIHPIGINAKAQSPNAARLFIQFAISREGQNIIRRVDRMPARPDIADPGWKDVDLKKLKLVSIDPSLSDNFQKYVDEFREIFKRK
jgi:iron(III) transport system substrate-binding protein